MSLPHSLLSLLFFIHTFILPLFHLKILFLLSFSPRPFFLATITIQPEKVSVPAHFRLLPYFDPAFDDPMDGEHFNQCKTIWYEVRVLHFHCYFSFPAPLPRGVDLPWLAHSSFSLFCSLKGAFRKCITYPLHVIAFSVRASFIVWQLCNSFAKPNSHPQHRMSRL